ncbi:phosphonate C-P lyase system protein PhnH [Catenovulum sp. SM1970]|uniref:phosphonate C-P lyase system protein PhnH n=1 Tax=Marinifaba aquimaris TaxID=2741323 RepID=UPI0015723D13|nr:phosphonate C-P lyase system protein PhnH [Marinifaba aquimaris]NTS78861.1 phosphonate C-P lyase system protein PhnH [Marinifaba aquimaris]
MLHVESVWLPKLQQQNYRHLLNAMSRPGSQNQIIHGVSDEYKFDYGFLPLLATLVDTQVSVSDPESLLKESEWKMLQTSKTEISNADFIIAIGQKPICEEPKLGALSHPEQSATVFLCVTKIGEGGLTIKLTGPGVNGMNTLKVRGLNEAWLERRNEWCASFPLGIDMFLCDRDSFIALPRTTRVEVM